MARLPSVGGDSGTWGEVLNEFLLESHDTDGSVKDGLITQSKLANNSVSQQKIDAGTPSSGQVLSYDGTDLVWATPSSSGTIPDASTSSKGIVQLAGDLSGTASSPVVNRVNGVTLPGTSPTAGQVLTATSGTASAWSTLPTAPVSSVSGRTGAVTLTSTDVGLANVNNTSDVNKPISSATQAALNAKADTSGLSTVATSGSYNDLSGRPTIPSAGTGLTNSAGVLSVNYGTSGTTAAAGNDSRITGAIQASTATAKGDIFAASASGTVGRVGIGADGQVLSADSSQSAGVRWTTPVSAPVSSVAGRTGAITLTSTDVGLSNVDNTSDANKPVSTATQTALNAKADTASLATVATSGSYNDLSSRPTIPSAGTGLTNTAGTLSVNYGTSGATAAAGNDSRITGALQSSTVTAKGDILAATGSSSLNRVAIGSDNQVLTADSSQAAGVRWMTLPTAPVSSVAGRTGAVTLTSSDVGLSNVNNTSDANKPISTATQSALDAKAPLASPALTGTPTAPTAAAATNTTQVATTAFVGTAITNAALADATTSTKGKVQLADATDVANATGTDVLTAGLIPASQGVTGIAKVQFIPNGGTVTGSPGAYTIIIEAGA